MKTSKRSNVSYSFRYEVFKTETLVPEILVLDGFQKDRDLSNYKTQRSTNIFHGKWMEKVGNEKEKKVTNMLHIV